MTPHKPSDENSGDDSKYFVVCFPGDQSVTIAYERAAAESEMEAPDIDNWVVFDDKCFKRKLTPERPYGRVLVGQRVSQEASTKEVYNHLRRYLGREVTEGVALADLVDLAARRNEEKRRETRRWTGWGLIGMFGALALVLAFISRGCLR
jgi:hypothetical protein